MNQHPNEGVPALYVDGSHLDRLRSKLDVDIDIQKLKRFACSNNEPAYYYRDLRDQAECDRNQRFFQWLRDHGFERRGTSDFRPDWYVRERYGSNLVELAVDIISAPQIGPITILAGDAKLVPLLGKLKQNGVPVTLISSQHAPQSIAPPPPLVALAATFIDLKTDGRFVRER